MRIVAGLAPLIASLAGLPGRAAPPPPAPSPIPSAFAELPLGAVRPSGWLRAQLRIQADGLGGHIDEFWPDIKDSAWIGGKAEGWERTPYWLDGLIPLAYLLDDARLKAKADRFVGTILERQAADGWMGPVGDNDPSHKPYDPWPLFVLFKALAQYQEATGDPRVVPAMLRASKKIDQVISRHPLESWGHFRGADLADGLLWLFEKTGDPSLVPLAEKVMAQSYDWRGHFEHFENYRGKTPAERAGLDSHGVNHAMGLKFAAVRHRLTGLRPDLASLIPMFRTLDTYHGQATGMFSSDEHLAGRGPSQGTELCTVAEAMYSIERIEAIAGRAEMGDRLEKIAYNALPATFKKDMTAHQYDQQCNQVACKVSEPKVYTTNGPDSNLYGLEPHFGCCAANMHQAWPKLVSHLWGRDDVSGGLVALAFGPSVVETVVGGKKARVEERTDYPFSGDVTFVVTAEPGEARLPVSFRVPAWADGFSYDIRFRRAGEAEGRLLATTRVDRAVPPWHGVHCDRDGETTISVRFAMSPRLREGDRGAVSIERGPLVYALNIEPEWRKIRGQLPFADFEVLPRSPWNYALQVDRADPSRSLAFESGPVGDRPFSPGGASNRLIVRGRRLPDWGLDRNAAAPPPEGPVESDRPLETLTLIPYGCTDLRIAEFPILKAP